MTIRALLLPLLVILLALPASADELPEVPLLPPVTTELPDDWTFSIALRAIVAADLEVAVRLPEAPTPLPPTETAIDTAGQVWHYRLPTLGGYTTIQFFDYPPLPDMGPLEFYKATTPFDEAAIALANSPDLFEVQGPCVIEGITYQGYYRVWPLKENLVVLAAMALPIPVEEALHAHAWISLRQAMDPLPPPPPPEIPTEASPAMNNDQNGQ